MAGDELQVRALEESYLDRVPDGAFRSRPPTSGRFAFRVWWSSTHHQTRPPSRPGRCPASVVIRV